MRKSKMQQKNKVSQQMKLFDWRAGELTGEVAGGTGTQPLNRDELLLVLERQRTLTEKLLERIVDYGNLMRAYESQLVCPTRVTILISGIEGLKVNGNRRGTIEYARWCGGQRHEPLPARLFINVSDIYLPKVACCLYAVRKVTSYLVQSD
jgi:hypothetical protein